MTRATLQVGGSRLRSSLERNGRRSAIYAQDTLDENEHNTIVYTGLVITRVNKGRGGDKYATIATSTSTKKIRGRDYIRIATLNVKTLAQTGRPQEVTHKLDRYTWIVVGLCEVRSKNLGEHPTDKGHILYYSGELDSHTRRVGFLVNKSIKNFILRCCPVSSRLISIRLRASPFNSTIVRSAHQQQTAVMIK